LKCFQFQIFKWLVPKVTGNESGSAKIAVLKSPAPDWALAQVLLKLNFLRRNAHFWIETSKMQFFSVKYFGPRALLGLNLPLKNL